MPYFILQVTSVTYHGNCYNSTYKVAQTKPNDGAAGVSSVDAQEVLRHQSSDIARLPSDVYVGVQVDHLEQRRRHSGLVHVVHRQVTRMIAVLQQARRQTVR